jgi:hypothetical protein
VKVPYRCFASASVMQTHPSGQEGVVDPCFTQYLGTWYAAMAFVGMSYPHTVSVHRVKVPYRSFA